ncbi:SDR family NAD(P)-dependent oxidoreductase [Novosphingobium malaysiense]|uniref:1,6-dihydroxycyclohexa-2,4-diene-1-carboxylate dehydrogenase n=1 Tax=Novosphingobium malaysiense TaxID=1348853 RepID=A0A0B1ZQR0_9SPHN|nr:SDR family NAD(P)-dependent oxidoreductase [Novosphingobium malaysiense]KHK92936.1 1,6-dihydroxycyclohexa-2,4-diene-1-carboxylate dehydrogenase [Novosphingobium malaysiense]
MNATSLRRRFEDKVAVVTGAAQGIGYEAALRLAREGASVVVADLAAGPAAEAVAAIEAEGARAVAAVGDLGTMEGARAAMTAATDNFGRLDVLVNNVGGTIWAKPYWHYSEEEIRAEVDRSFWPALWCSRAVIEPMRASGGGAIVNVGSNAAAGGIYRIPYSACKGAVVALTECLAVELAPLNIRVNCLSPGGTAAPERKTPRESRPFDEQEREWWGQFVKLVQNEELIAERATAAEQAGVIAFLASHEAGHVTGEIVETGRRGIRIGEVLGFVP